MPDPRQVGAEEQLRAELEARGFPAPPKPQYSAKVTTADGILHEIYEVSATYQATLKRMAVSQVSESDVTPDHYMSAMRTYLASITDNIGAGEIGDAAVRSLLIGLATFALRWAKQLRPQVPVAETEGTT